MQRHTFFELGAKAIDANLFIIPGRYLDNADDFQKDNKCAFIQGITHIIRGHHARKLGYVSGPLTNVDAVERLEAYRVTLEQEGIPYNEDYVIYGNFEESSEGIIGEFADRCPEMVNRYMETASEGIRGLFMFCTIDNDKDVDVFQALATVDRLLYQEKRAKKLRRMAE